MKSNRFTAVQHSMRVDKVENYSAQLLINFRSFNFRNGFQIYASLILPCFHVAECNSLR